MAFFDISEDEIEVILQESEADLAELQRVRKGCAEMQQPGMSKSRAASTSAWEHFLS